MMLLAKKQFTDFVQSHQLFKPEDKVLLTVSGGKDSVLMAKLFAASGFRFAIAHCNFNLRGAESLRDERFVSELAKKLNVPFFLKRFDTKGAAVTEKISIQMAARNLRYEFFEQIRVSQNFDKIAVAHHQNDAIETVLINLIRGTGIAGLHGIKVNQRNIVRPLMCFTTDEIESLVKDNDIAYVDDSSNASNKYMRNKIRLDIIPEMQKLNPSLAQTFRQNISYFSQLETLLNNHVESLSSQIIIPEGNNIKIEICNILKLNPQQLLLFELLRPYGFNTTQVDNLLACLNGLSGKQFFSKSAVLTVDREFITIHPLNITEHTEELLLNDLGNFVFGNHQFTTISSSKMPESFELKKAYVAFDKLIFPLKIRYWQQGDRFRPFGMKGLKKLSDYFVNQKIPLQQKSKIPILVNGNNEIIWICGYRSDERYKVNSDTKKIIIFDLQN